MVSKRLIVITVAVVVISGSIIAWLMLSKPALPPGFAASNGRLEAKQVDIATKYHGRIKEVLADEGDTVNAGQEVLPAGGKVLALIDLSDVYMYLFLPEPIAGKIALGSQAQLVLDAAPEYPIRALVS